jgi:hypothetical protein
MIAKEKPLIIHMTKILIILLALCATALASPTPTPSASPSFDFTPMVDWRCTIDVAADRITLFNAKTGEYLASGPAFDVGKRQSHSRPIVPRGSQV